MISSFKDRGPALQMMRFELALWVGMSHHPKEIILPCHSVKSHCFSLEPSSLIFVTLRAVDIRMNCCLNKSSDKLSNLKQTIIQMSDCES